jgi:hypothetical protein
MAINVNTVYRTVLSLLNREQRGFLTPDQYNRYARMAQLDLLEKAFLDYNRYLTRKETGSINDEYANLAKLAKEKIDIFSTSSTLNFIDGVALIPNNLYKCIMVSTGSRAIEVEEIQKSDLPIITSSKLTAPSVSYPIYYKQASSVYILPSTITTATIDYVYKPNDPLWAFTTGSTYGDMQYSSANSIDFSLHDSEEVNLIAKILLLAGVTIKDPNVVQIAKQEEVQKINQENS